MQCGVFSAAVRFAQKMMSMDLAQSKREGTANRADEIKKETDGARQSMQVMKGPG